MSVQTTSTVILSAPQAWGKTRDAKQLLSEFGCKRVIDDWHPPMPVCQGALHLTNMHPLELTGFSGGACKVIGRGWA